jgi:GNAT superfamily N-acetyltransferase
VRNVSPLIRKATPADREKIFPLVEDFATSFKPEEPAFNHAFEQISRNDCACLLVADLDDRIIGYCLGFDHFAFYANGRVSWVEEMMVHLEFRRENVGRALMNQFEVWSRARNAKLIGLATRRAAFFYEALGYENSAVFFRKCL